MFGWEFPPHILGGLGTASYGLTKGMWECGDMDITFVIPKPFGDEEKHFAHIIGMSQVPVAWRDVSRDYVEQRIGNVMDPDLYFRLGKGYKHIHPIAFLFSFCKNLHTPTSSAFENLLD